MTTTTTAGAQPAKPKRIVPRQPKAKPQEFDPERLLSQIEKQEARVAKAESAWMDAKSHAKMLKEQLEGEVALLRKLCKASDQPLSARMEPNGWKREKLASIFDDEDVEALEKWCRGKTLEKLSSKLRKTPKGFADIEGVGPAKAGKLADTLERFWKANPGWAPDLVAKDDAAADPAKADA